MTPQEISNQLAHFTGTENWYRHPIVRKMLYTDGVQFIAESCGAYWLLDEICFRQIDKPALARAEFQVWEFTVKNSAGVLSVSDGNNNKLIRNKRITFTDFPLSKIMFYVQNNTVMLPSEY